MLLSKLFLLFLFSFKAEYYLCLTLFQKEFWEFKENI